MVTPQILLVPPAGGNTVPLTELERLRQRVAELELRCEEYRILDETSDAIPFRLQPDLDLFTYIGPQAERLLGVATPAWHTPGFFEARLSPEHRVATIEQFRLVVEFAAEHEAEFRFQRDDGSWMWLRCAMRLLTPASGPIVAGHFMDITLRRDLASDQAQSQKLEAIGRLSAGIAHEMNTPLQFICDNISFVRDGVRDLLGLVDEYRHASTALAAPEVTRLDAFAETKDLSFLADNMPRALDATTEGLERVSMLVRSMRQFAHPDGERQLYADINAAIESTIAISATEYRRVADVETELGSVPAFGCYINELNQVFLNIIVNAAHAIADVVGTSGERGKIRIATRCEGSDIVIAIADTGGGIPVHVRDRIFDPFFTTKDIGRGTGQGLSIARGIVEKHGGSLTFETTTGTGTTFFVRLPIG